MTIETLKTIHNSLLSSLQANIEKELWIMVAEISSAIVENQKQIGQFYTDEAITKLKALNNNLQIQILKLLVEKGEMTVSSIFLNLKMEQSITSQHLAKMRNAGLVNSNKKGKFVYYSINLKQIDYLNTIAEYINKLEIALFVEI